MRALKVALSTAALVFLLGAAGRPIAATEGQPRVAQRESLSSAYVWYHDPVAVTLGLIALFTLGDIALLIAHRSHRGNPRPTRRRHAQPRL